MMLARLMKPKSLRHVVIAGSDASPLLEFGKEGFDTPALFVGDAVVAALYLAMAEGRFTALLGMSSHKLLAL
jgi:hypothetical protein